MLPPSANQLPAQPSCWYLFGRASEFGKRPVSKTLLGRRLVGFRTNDGRVAVLDAHCAHQGADLGFGEIVGDRVQCPYHHWEYDAAGRCRHIPAQAEIPEFAEQRSYPVEERHGLIFFFNGREPLFPLPFFFDRRPEDFVAGRPFHFLAECSWPMLAANAFDGQHYQTVHDRRPTAAPEVDCPAPYARRVRFRAEVAGRSIYDRLLRRFVGRFVDISITNWGGPFFVVTAFFRRAESYILFAPQPIAEHQTRLDVVVCARRSGWRLVRRFLQPLALAVRSQFTRGFIEHEITRLAGIRYSPETLLPSDQMLIEFFDWAARLSTKPAAKRSSGAMQPSDACSNA